MPLPLRVFAPLLFSVFATPALAQNKYDVFVGQYMAAVLIAQECSNRTVSDVPGAAALAKSENGLREQKVLRLLYYSKTAQLEAVGRYALTERKVDPDTRSSVCGFGKQVAAKNDLIGRFLK